MIYYWVYHIILFSGRRKLPGLVFLANSGSNRIVFRNSPCHIFLFGDLGYMDSSGSNFRDRTRDSFCGCLVLFIHCWVEYACSTHPCSGSNCLTGSPSLITKVCTTAPHKGPAPNQTYGGLNPMVIPINSYSHRKLIGHRNFAINLGRFFPVTQWFFS